MNELSKKIEAECISVHDWDMLVQWLVEVAASIDDPAHAPNLKSSLNDVFQSRIPLMQY